MYGMLVPQVRFQMVALQADAVLFITPMIFVFNNNLHAFLTAFIKAYCQIKKKHILVGSGEEIALSSRGKEAVRCTYENA